MWQAAIRPQDVYLYHWGLSSRKEKHKYIAKIGEGDDARYFYTQEELQAYKDGKTSADKKQSLNPITKAKSAVNTLKKAVSDDDNMYNVKSKNYKEKKKQIQATDEWKEITKDKKSEYRKKDSSGKTYYDYDQYLVDKKHPVLDALSDIGYGRKISVRHQDVNTFVAGVKDYVKMAESTVQTVAGVSIGLLTAKIKNQQGSYDDEKKAIKKKFNTLKDTVSSYEDLYEQTDPNSAIDDIANVLKTTSSSKDTTKLIDDVATSAKSSIKNKSGKEFVDAASNAAKTYANSEEGQEKIAKAKDYGKKMVDSYLDSNDTAKYAVESYAKSKDMSYDEAKESLYNLPSTTLKKYAAGDLTTDEVMKQAEEYAKSDEGQTQINKAKDYGESKAEEVKTSAEQQVQKKTNEYISKHPDETAAAIYYYAKAKGISYDDAQHQIYTLPVSEIEKYANMSE